jgi:type VII secretion protein EccB
MRAPATRDQVDAYRFSLRRLETALVRGDGVPLYEQVRTQRRAAAAGAMLGLLAVAVSAIVALVSPRPDWARQAVVVGRESGAMYVVAHGEDRLVPVANLVAARLVLGALQRGGAAGGDPATAVPVIVPDDVLATAPRTPAAGVAGAESVRLDAPALAPRWAVCDRSEARDNGQVRLAETAVVAGAVPAGHEQPATTPDGVLLSVPGGATWLVVDGRRHRVDTTDPLVIASLGLTGARPRFASAALVNALPEGVALERPVVADAGDPGPHGLPERVGEVILVSPAGGEPQPHVVVAGGIQPVAPALADLLTATRPGSRTGAPNRDGEPRRVDAIELADVPRVEELPVRGWPAAAPRLVEVGEAPVVCWWWTGEGQAPASRVLLGGALPAPAQARTVQLAQADRGGPLLDTVVLGAGGGPVRAVSAAGPLDSGGVFLVSETGVAYGVAAGETARVLGISAPLPAPEPALALLPGRSAPALDVATAGAVVDVPAQPGG